MMGDFGTILLFICGTGIFVMLLMAAALVRMSGLVSKREEAAMGEQVTKASLRSEALGWHATAADYRRALESVFEVCRTAGTSDYAARYAALEIAAEVLSRGKDCKAVIDAAEAQPNCNTLGVAMAAFYGGVE